MNQGMHTMHRGDTCHFRVETSHQVLMSKMVRKTKDQGIEMPYTTLTIANEITPYCLWKKCLVVVVLLFHGMWRFHHSGMPPRQTMPTLVVDGFMFRLFLFDLILGG